MVVHNLAEYVAYHQAKLRKEQAAAASTSASAASPSSAPPKKHGVNEVHSKISFDASIGSSDKLIVLDCFATWCGPCKVIAPEVVKFSEEFQDKAEFYKVDVDQVPDLAQELNVRAMPTFMLFKNGEKVGEVVGADKRALRNKIEANL